MHSTGTIIVLVGSLLAPCHTKSAGQTTATAFA